MTKVITYSPISANAVSEYKIALSNNAGGLIVFQKGVPTEISDKQYELLIKMDSEFKKSIENRNMLVESGATKVAEVSPDSTPQTPPPPPVEEKKTTARRTQTPPTVT